MNLIYERPLPDHDLRAVLLLAFACAALPPLSAREIEVPFQEVAKFLYTDPGSLNRKCLAASIVNGGGKLLAVETPELEAGVYRVHMRLKVSHTISKHTARLQFALKAEGGDFGGERKLRIVDFELPGAYQDCTFPVEVRKKDTWLTLSASWRWKSSQLDKRPPEPVKLPTVSTEAKLEDTPEEVEPLEHQLKELPYHLATDRIWLEYLGDVAIHDLEVDKIRYKPNETAQVTGAVVNYADAPRDLELGFALIRRMDDVEEVATQPIKLEPKGTARFAVQAPLDERLWGHEIRCVAKEAGRALTSASEYFTVHTNPWAVAIGAFPMDLTIYRAGPNGRNAEANAVNRKRKYQNQLEFVFWAPCDYGDLTPDGDYWSGQMRRRNSAESTKWLIDAFHKAGIACAFYSKIQTGGGKAGYEVLRKHPEWLSPVFYDVAQLDRWDRSTEMSVWPQLGVRMDIPDPSVHHAQEIVRSVKQFGWDMIRYDSSLMWEESGDVLRLVKRIVGKECPDLKWGYNTGYHRTDKHPPPTSGKWGSDPNAEWNKPPVKPVFDMLCEDGSMIMGEYNTHAADGWTYTRYGSRHIYARKLAHERGGHIVFCPFEPNNHTDTTYQEILVLAARAHRAWDPAKGSRLGPKYEQFATRFAGCLWDNQAVPFENAREWIDWGENAQHLFLWDSYACLRKSGEKGTDVILQLVNMPPERVNSYDDCRVPPPRENLVCSMRLPEGVKPRDVWCATPDPHLTLEKLPLQVKDGRATFTVPKLRFWNMVVLRLEGDFGP